MFVSISRCWKVKRCPPHLKCRRAGATSGHIAYDGFQMASCSPAILAQSRSHTPPQKKKKPEMLTKKAEMVCWQTFMDHCPLGFVHRVTWPVSKAGKAPIWPLLGLLPGKLWCMTCQGPQGTLSVGVTAVLAPQIYCHFCMLHILCHTVLWVAALSQMAPRGPLVPVRLPGKLATFPAMWV